VKTRLAPASVPDPCSPSPFPRSHVPSARVTSSLDLSAYHSIPRSENDACVGDQTGGYEPEHLKPFSPPPPAPYDGGTRNDPSPRQSGFSVQPLALALSGSIIPQSGGLPIAKPWTRPNHIDSPSEETTPSSEVPYLPPDGEGFATGSILPQRVASPHPSSLALGSWSVDSGDIERVPRMSLFEASTESRRERSMNLFQIDRNLSERTLGDARASRESPRDWSDSQPIINAEAELVCC
jgi:hypothetical protein